jgi:hypothetical protein
MLQVNALSGAALGAGDVASPLAAVVRILNNQLLVRGPWLIVGVVM